MDNFYDLKNLYREKYAEMKANISKDIDKVTMVGVNNVLKELKPKIEELLNNPRLYGMGYVPTDATYMGWEGKPLKDIGNIYHSIVDRLLEIEAYIEIGLGE